MKPVTNETYESEVKNAPVAVLDFWAPWCGPCRMMAPVMEDIEGDYPDVLFGKVNVDEEGTLATRFSVESIPTIAVLVNGEVKETSVGYVPRARITDMIERYI